MKQTVSKSERETQNRVVELFNRDIGYRYLGNFQYKADNSNVEVEVLGSWLKRQGYTEELVNSAVKEFTDLTSLRNVALYDANKKVYQKLRYGVQVQERIGENHETIKLIDWSSPENNEFAIAEEVTLKGGHERRPDIVLYINGIAFGVIELKNSRVSIGDGIRQLLSNQKLEFNQSFFNTVQIVFAGSDSEGLKYGTIGTPEKYFLKWKEDEEENDGYKLDKYLKKMCDKKRILDILYNFVLFDGGVKKLPRVHQYFGCKAAIPFIDRKESGIIWHTQGAGKSILMVVLAKWILENKPNGRVVVVTDRDELDKQIEGVFNDAGESIQRTKSGRELLTLLGTSSPRLISTLIHKFGKKDVDNFEEFIKEIKAQNGSHTVGDIYCLVDECHRTNSGRLHSTMKAYLPNATFIGFTGTPLLKKDKKTTLEVFGRYIHTYKFDEAVEDGVVLDLLYEARDVDQELTSEDRVDAWFDAKTRGLNEWQKGELRKQWGTMQQVLSSASRMDKIIRDIQFDFGTKPRLSSERGNAMLVASSIYEACKYYDLFQKTPFKGKCAVITSYNPQAGDVSKEEVGANSETDKQFIYNLYTHILKDIAPEPKKTKSETYDDQMKELFTKEPARMQLLIVVDKLLTGFDAPSCTYLYLDKKMQDHGLFQAICRVNRLDGDDKVAGYIVDYKDLFNRVHDAIGVYTKELAPDDENEQVQDILIEDRLEAGKSRLDNAREALFLLCEPVEPPKTELEFIHYFCGNTEIQTDIDDRAPIRDQFYRAVASFIRAYANIADELEGAGYTSEQIATITLEKEDYLKLREAIRLASYETIDLKVYEADMRHLIDSYIEAKEPRKISPFDEMPLLEIVVKTGIADAINAMPDGIKSRPEAVAETIENNVRSKIIKEQLNDPAFYSRMSKLLDELIAKRKQSAIEYEEYLQLIAELVKKVDKGYEDTLPESLDTSGKRAIYNLLSVLEDEEFPFHELQTPYGNEDFSAEGLTMQIHNSIISGRPDDWRGDEARERAIKKLIYNVLSNVDMVERLFPVIKEHQEF